MLLLIVTSHDSRLIIVDYLIYCRPPLRDSFGTINYAAVMVPGHASPFLRSAIAWKDVSEVLSFQLDPPEFNMVLATL